MLNHRLKVPGAEKRASEIPIHPIPDFHYEQVKPFGARQNSIHCNTRHPLCCNYLDSAARMAP